MAVAVGAGGRVVGHAVLHHRVQGGVGLSAAAAGEPVAIGAPAGDGPDALNGHESGLARVTRASIRASMSSISLHAGEGVVSVGCGP